MHKMKPKGASSKVLDIKDVVMFTPLQEDMHARLERALE